MARFSEAPNKGRIRYVTSQELLVFNIRTLNWYRSDKLVSSISTKKQGSRHYTTSFSQQLLSTLKSDEPLFNDNEAVGGMGAFESDEKTPRKLREVSQ